MSAPQKCIDLANRINIPANTAPHELLPYINQMITKGMTDLQACTLMKNWLFIGWVPPFVVSEMTMDGMETSFRAKQAAKLEEENEALRFEVEQLRATMKQMTDWHNKIDDWLKVREEKISK